MTDLVATVLGSLGAAGLLWAFYATSHGGRQQAEPLVAWANLLGSSLLVVNTAHFHAWPPLVVNAVWAVIAVWNLRPRRAIEPQ
ncbi:MAG: hypothetical protein P1V81_04470 [Planctomycetota bacterium]|nr:hypothetical protein [Planctomycetota bacterium]